MFNLTINTRRKFIHLQVHYWSVMIKYLEFLNRKVIRNLFKEATRLNASVLHLGCARCSIIVLGMRKALAIIQEAAENQIFA